MFPHTTCMLFKQTKDGTVDDEDSIVNSENSTVGGGNNSDWVLCSPRNKHSFIMKIERRRAPPLPTDHFPDNNNRCLLTTIAGNNNNATTDDDMSIAGVADDHDDEEQQVSKLFYIIFYPRAFINHNDDKVERWAISRYLSYVESDGMWQRIHGNRRSLKGN